MERVNMPDIIWATVPGYNDAYEISSEGVVRSIGRVVPYGKNGSATYKERILKQTKIRNGYFTVKLAYRGATKTEYVHVLMLLAFVGPRPVTKARGEIRHLDGDKTNNRLDNLVYGTIHENVADRMRHNAMRGEAA